MLHVAVGYFNICNEVSIERYVHFSFMERMKYILDFVPDPFDHFIDINLT